MITTPRETGSPQPPYRTLGTFLKDMNADAANQLHCLNPLSVMLTDGMLRETPARRRAILDGRAVLVAQTYGEPDLAARYRNPETPGMGTDQFRGLDFVEIAVNVEAQDPLSGCSGTLVAWHCLGPQGTIERVAREVAELAGRLAATAQNGA